MGRNSCVQIRRSFETIVTTNERNDIGCDNKYINASQRFAIAEHIVTILILIDHVIITTNSTTSCSCILKTIVTINECNDIRCDDKCINALQRFAMIDNCVTHSNDFNSHRSCNYRNKFDSLLHSENDRNH